MYTCKLMFTCNEYVFMHVYKYNYLYLYAYVCIYVCCCCLLAKLCLTLCDPMDHSPPGSSVHEISQSRIVEWVAISFSTYTLCVCVCTYISQFGWLKGLQKHRHLSSNEHILCPNLDHYIQSPLKGTRVHSEEWLSSQIVQGRYIMSLEYHAMPENKKALKKL